VTVNYQDKGTVYGLTRTTACADKGDSGGPFLSGDQAQGVLSGGTNGCSPTGTSDFQPVNEILSAYGLALTLEPTCSASFGSFYVASGDTTVFSFTSANVPPGSTSYLYGTKNGLPDANGIPYGVTSGAYLVANSPGLEGLYARWVVIRGPDGAEVCKTNTTSVFFQAPPATCSVSFSSPVVPSGGSVVFSFASGGPIPPGSVTYLYGKKDGAVDTDGMLFNLTSGDFLIANSPGLAGFYERWAVIKAPGDLTVCTTNVTTVHFQ
jgi:hypothetical protein